MWLWASLSNLSLTCMFQCIGWLVLFNMFLIFDLCACTCVCYAWIIDGLILYPAVYLWNLVDHHHFFCIFWRVTLCEAYFQMIILFCRECTTSNIYRLNFASLAIIISVGPIVNCKLQMECTHSQEARDSRHTKCGTKWLHAIFDYNWARSQCLRFLKHLILKYARLFFWLSCAN